MDCGEWGKRGGRRHRTCIDSFIDLSDLTTVGSLVAERHRYVSAGWLGGLVEFRVLGPLEIRAGRGWWRPAGQRQQRLLAALLLAPNRAVSLSHLVDVVWEDCPPATAKRQVQNLISALRRDLVEAGSSTQVLRGDGPGYRISVADGELDLDMFERHIAQGHYLAGLGEMAQAVEALRAALGLWRGPALAGTTGRVIEAAAIRLDEQRLAATEQCLDLELSLGRHFQLAGELRELAATHPLRERLTGQLMLALYRAGRQADALQAYDLLCKRLVNELGLSPSSEIQQLHGAILRNEPAIAAPPHANPRMMSSRAASAGPVTTASGCLRVHRPAGGASPTRRPVHHRRGTIHRCGHLRHCRHRRRGQDRHGGALGTSGPTTSFPTGSSMSTCAATTLTSR